MHDEHHHRLDHDYRPDDDDIDDDNGRYDDRHDGDERHHDGGRRHNISQHDRDDHLERRRHDDRGDDDGCGSDDHSSADAARVAEAPRSNVAWECAAHAAPVALVRERHEVGVHALVTPAPAISVPAVGIYAAISTNVNAADLATGAGHYPGTGWPGQGRTIGLAGHDVTYVPAAEGGRVFHQLIAAHVGDRVYIRWHRKTFVYRITAKQVVPPNDVAVLRDVGHERLVLTTCYPPGSASSRLVAFARPIAAGMRWRPAIAAAAVQLRNVLERLFP